jgi:hypothetical protein
MPLPPGVKLSDLGLAPNVVADLLQQGQLSQEDMAGYNVGGAGPLEFGPDVNWDEVGRDVQKSVGDYLEKDKLLNGPPTVAEQRDEQFGDDMAWLDPIFQQSAPTRERVQETYGQTADEHAAARQRQAADELFGLYKQGGLGAQERAARAKARAESEDLLRGQREADMQNLAERGMGGSGAELAAMLGGNQAAGQRLSQADLQTSADAERRALDALMGGTNIESGLQKSADDYTMKGAGLIGDIEGKTKDRLFKGYQATQAARNEWQGKLLGTKKDIAQGTAASDATEQHAGYGIGKDVATTDAGAANDLTGKKNVSTVGVDQGSAGRAAGAGSSIVTNTGDDKKALGEGVDDLAETLKKGSSLGLA